MVSNTHCHDDFTLEVSKSKWGVMQIPEPPKVAFSAWAQVTAASLFLSHVAVMLPRTHTHSCTYVDIYLSMPIHYNIHIDIKAYSATGMNIRIQVYKRTHTHANIYTHKHTQTHTYTRALTHKLTHIYAHVYAN